MNIPSLILLVFGIVAQLQLASANAIYLDSHHSNALSLERRDFKTEFGNYIVNRTTQQQFYEEQPIYVRLGMKALFGSWFILSPFVRFQLKQQTANKGKVDDSPESVKEIPDFIKTYNIKLDELAEPDPSKYKTFNEFFYRKLKDGARTVDSKDDQSVLVSPADCRLTTFASVSDATKFWIKGKNFNLKNLLKDDGLANDFDGGSLAIFRLAPQDYHRFHAPSDCKVESIKEIPGEYYTVNPLAVKENLDVLTDNKRVVTIMSTPAFGKMAFVSVGALMVASINFTGAGKFGAEMKKGDDAGYFAFGGSTVILVFQKDKMKWDDDLLKTSNNSLETLVRMGEHVGKATSSS